MSIGGTINGFTTKEVRAIYTYLDKPISSSKALSILEMYEPELIPNPNGPNDFYISTNSEEFFSNLKQHFGTKIQKQKIADFESLKHTAINYCEDNDIPLD